MGIICGLEVGGFFRVMVLLVRVQAEVSPGAPSKHKGVAGCVHEPCYCREWKYCPFKGVNDFGYAIQARENTPICRAGRCWPRSFDIIGIGDNLTVEQTLGLSHQMLRASPDFGFLLSALERSPLVPCDLDLFKAISDRTPSFAPFHLILTPGPPDHG